MPDSHNCARGIGLDVLCGIQDETGMRNATLGADAIGSPIMERTLYKSSRPALRVKQAAQGQERKFPNRHSSCDGMPAAPSSP